ncbi:MAG: metalloprotease family protein [Candidatus Dependentiae bacterium]|nr:metalloprotease family protein [Candidatus Dependentiae bacterium]
MIFIPGELIAMVTFPGIILHEIAHRFVCDIFKIPVYEVMYFEMDSSRAGHVIHQKVDSVTKNFLIAVAPLLFNTVVCMIFTFPYSSASYITGDSIPNFFSAILWWIGMSAGINAFPSNQDVANLSCSEEETTFFAGLVQLIVQCLNFLRRVWLDFLYAYGISLILPYLIFG